MNRKCLTYASYVVLFFSLLVGASLSHVSSVSAQQTRQSPAPQATAPAENVKLSGAAFRNNEPVGAGIAVEAIYGTGRSTAATDASSRYFFDLPAASLTVGEGITFLVQGSPVPQVYVVPQSGGIASMDLFAVFSAAPSAASPQGQPAAAPVQNPPPMAPTPVLAAPTGLMDAYGPAGASQPPSVQLRPVEDVIYRNGQGILEVVINNPLINQRAIVVDLTISAPSNLTISGQDFAGSLAAGEARTPFIISPGQSRTIIVNVGGKIAGDYLVQSVATYWPQGYPQLNQNQSLQHQFRVDFQSQPPTPNPALSEGDANRAGEEGGRPGACSIGGAPVRGDMTLMGVGFMALLGMVGLRRRV